MRIVMYVLVAVSFLMAESIDSTVNSIMGMKLYRSTQLKHQLEKIEKEFPNLSLSTDSVLLKELYGYEIIDDRNVVADGTLRIIDSVNSFEKTIGEINFQSQLNAPTFEERYIYTPRLEDSGRTLFKVGGYSFVGGLAFLGGAVVSSLLENMMPGGNSVEYNEDGTITESKSKSLTPFLGITGLVLSSLGGTAMVISLPLVISGNKHWRVDNCEIRVAQHNRNRIIQARQALSTK